MIVLINYADAKYRKTQRFNSWTGKHIGGADKVIEYGPGDMDAGFRASNARILAEKRGNGLWLWKPYFIDKTLREMNEGDYLFYADSGAFFIGSIRKIIRSMGEEDIWLYGLPLAEWQFTKKSVFREMDALTDRYAKTNQYSGSFMLFRVSDASRRFVQEWLRYCCRYELISPSGDEAEEPGFSAHREDQSIVSILAKKNHLTMHKDPSQYGNLPEKYRTPQYEYMPFASRDPYGVVLIHHRTAGVDFMISFKQFLCGILPRRIGLKLISH